MSAHAHSTACTQTQRTQHSTHTAHTHIAHIQHSAHTHTHSTHSTARTQGASGTEAREAGSREPDAPGSHCWPPALRLGRALHARRVCKAPTVRSGLAAAGVPVGPRLGQPQRCGSRHRGPLALRPPSCRWVGRGRSPAPGALGARLWAQDLLLRPATPHTHVHTHTHAHTVLRVSARRLPPGPRSDGGHGDATLHMRGGHSRAPGGLCREPLREAANTPPGARPRGERPQAGLLQPRRWGSGPVPRLSRVGVWGTALP